MVGVVNSNEDRKKLKSTKKENRPRFLEASCFYFSLSLLSATELHFLEKRIYQIRFANYKVPRRSDAVGLYHLKEQFNS